jgi:hypothetical protein
MTGSGTFHQADEEQSDSSMMALHVHEFGRRILRSAMKQVTPAS